MNLTIGDLTVERLVDFYQNARQKDLLECRHSTGITFGKTKISELFETAECVCGYDKDTNEVYGIGGYAQGYVWMLCTNRVVQHPIHFLRFMRQYLNIALSKYEKIENYVWLGNELHTKWLKWMGAEFDDSQIVRNGCVFQHFTFRRKE